MLVDGSDDRLVPKEVSGLAAECVVEEHVDRYKFASQFVKDKVVLDLACGAGYGSKILSEAGASQVDGVDYSQDAVEIANKNYKLGNISFSVGDICSYKADNTYDFITCFETIEHVENYQAAIANLHSLLADDGILLISSPNRPVTSPAAKALTDKPSNIYHSQEFTPEELKSILLDHGFKVGGTDLYGQRYRKHFSNTFLRKIHTMLFRSNKNSSSIVSQQTGTPLYFIFAARKS